MTTSIPDDAIAHFTMGNIESAVLVDEKDTYNIALATTNIVANDLVDGHLGDALYFSGALGSGTSNILTVPLNPAIELGDNFTISCWINPTDAVNYRGAFGNHYVANSPPSGIVGFQFWDNEWVAGWYSNGAEFLARIPAGDIPFGSWTHVQLKCTNGTDLEVKVNNNVKFSQTGIQIAHNIYFYIGAAYLPDSSSSPRNFRGAIDSFRIYDRATTSAEDDALFLEALEVKFINGTAIENLAVNSWIVSAYRLDTGRLTVSTISNDGTYSLGFSLSDSVAHSVVLTPYQGVMWKAEEDLIIDDLRFPTDPISTSYYYKVTTAGQTGTMEPVWPTTPGQTVVDGSVTFECVERLVQPRIESPLIPI